MNELLLLADANNPGQIQQIAESFGVDWTHLIAQIISFCIVCALLHRFAYRRVLATLAERRQRIEEGLANAERIKAELAQAQAQHHQVLVDANTQATRLIEEAHAAAARVLERETQRAAAAAEQIIAHAREQSARDHEKMLSELKREIGRLAVQASMVVAKKILTPQDQQRLAEEAVREVAA